LRIYGQPRLVSWGRLRTLGLSSTNFRDRKPSAFGVRFLKSPRIQGLILCLIALASRSGLWRVFWKSSICFRQLTEYESRSPWRDDFSHQGTCLAQALNFGAVVHCRIIVPPKPDSTSGLCSDILRFLAIGFVIRLCQWVRCAYTLDRDTVLAAASKCRFLCYGHRTSRSSSRSCRRAAYS